MSQRSGLLTSQLCHSRFAKWIFYCSPSGFELHYIPLYLSGLQNGSFCFSILLCAIYLCICPEIVLSLWYTTERLLFDSLRRVARREKKTCQLPLLCGRRQAGGLPSFFFLYYLYLFVFLLFTSIIFFEIICSSFLREEVSRRVVFIRYFWILWCLTMKNLFRLPVPLQVLVPVPLLAHRSKASSAGKHRAQTHIFSENEKGNKDKDNGKESSQ